MTGAAGRTDAPGAAKRPHVHVRIGDCDIAIPVETVRQALPLPAGGLARLPRRHGAISGLLEVGGQSVPVVALDRWVPLGVATDSSLPRVLVLGTDGALIGIQVDAVLGVKAIDAAAIRKVHQDADGEELFEAIVPAAGGVPVLSLLEVGRLMRLTEVWCDEAELARAPGAGRAADRGLRPPGVRHAVFEIGEQLWAIPARFIERIAKAPVPELQMRVGDRSIGICQWEGRKMPLIDIAAAAGGGPVPGAGAGAEADPTTWMAVVGDARQSLGIPVARCRQLLDLPTDRIAPSNGDPVRAGIAVLDGLGKVSVLDVEKLFRLVPESTISRTPAPGRRTAAGSAGDDLHSYYIAFEADRAYATPVDGILAIVPLPRAVADDLAGSRPAAIDWRGRTVKVVLLPSINGAAHGPEPRLIVVVKTADGDAAPVGIAIHRLTDWIPAHAARRSGLRMASVGEFSMITIDGPGKPASLVVVDLAQMAYLLS